MNRYLQIALKLAPAAVTIVVGVSALGMVRSSSEAVRVRNALLFDTVEFADLRWRPPDYPASFKLERQEPPPDFHREIEKIKARVPATATDFENAIAIGRHLAIPGFLGEAIQQNSVATLHGIVDEAQGYCADFSQVYNGLAHTSELPVREWGMSFDGFGGDGHAFNEFYDRDRKQWVFVDSYFSFYTVDRASGEPLSVLDIFDRLENPTSRQTIAVVPILEKRFLFNSHDNALDYYMDGKHQLFMWSGNNVFEYDNSPIVAFVGGVSRTLEQVAAIASGVHPRMLVVRTSENADTIAALRDTRNRFLLLLVTGTVAFGLLLFQASRWFRRRRNNRQSQAPAGTRAVTHAAEGGHLPPGA